MQAAQEGDGSRRALRVPAMHPPFAKQEKLMDRDTRYAFSLLYAHLADIAEHALEAHHDHARNATGIRLRAIEVLNSLRAVADGFVVENT